jgi:hypothetical protein
MTATAFTQRRELAHRTSDGIEVTLLWSKPSNRVAIVVCDSRSGEALEFDVDGSVALDAFNHPYAYAATHRTPSPAISPAAADALATATDR